MTSTTAIACTLRAFCICPFNVGLTGTQVFVSSAKRSTLEQIRGRKSKHLKGRFGPRVSNGNVFGPKEVGLGPVKVTVTFLDQRRSVWAPC